MVVTEIQHTEAPAPKRISAIAARGIRICGRRFASGAAWVFGFIALVVGLAILAAIPLAQFIALGYLLNASANVARTGSLRRGIVGVRKAARAGGIVVGIVLASIPMWLVGSFSRSADLIDPGGSVARNWRLGLVAIFVLTSAHIVLASLRGARLRHYLWPFGHPLWLLRRRGVIVAYRDARDGLWDFVVSLTLPRLFRLGCIGFLGGLAWLCVPAFLLGIGARFPLLGILGVLLLGLIVPLIPFLQVNFAVEEAPRTLFQIKKVRERFARAPLAFAFALAASLLAAVPLNLLKIEMIPREAAWLPSLLFVLFLAPPRLLVGWAYYRSSTHEMPRRRPARILGRLLILGVTALYVLSVFLAQYTAWDGVKSFYQQHAFLVPVPF